MQPLINAGALPKDLLFDVLLRLPAKELCRLRAVSRSWRSLTSDPLFVGAHASRHQGSLFLANFRGDRTHIHVVDLSGRVVKRIAIPDGHRVMCTRLDLACVAATRNSCHVLNPATGAAYVLPQGPAARHVNCEHLRDSCTSFAFGRISATGEYKVLRIFNWSESSMPTLGHNLYEVSTISSGANNAQWRGMLPPDHYVDPDSSVVINGVVHFLMHSIYFCWCLASVSPGIHPDCILSFDLEKEEWKKDLRGPISSGVVLDSYDGREEYISIRPRITIAELKGSLVLVHYRRYLFSMDLWFLTDFDSGLWTKVYSIDAGSVFPFNEYHVKPLLVLDDGRLMVLLVTTGQLLIYDPNTNTGIEVETRHLDAVGMYTGTLLSLQGGDML